jgi:hypothetical protein
MASSSNTIFIFSTVVVGIIAISVFMANKNKTKDEYDMIKKYLLNDSPLNGFEKPKIWIHTKYEINARKWKTFYSRNTTDLNQPYIHLTVKTIINHCGDHFNICLIDDNSFSALIPTWDVNMNQLSEPMKSRMRHLGLMQLIYYYGGMIVPNSFLCLRNMIDLYNGATQAFVCENINRTTNLQKSVKQPMYIPDGFFMGARKNDPIIKEYIEYIKQRNHSSGGHFDREIEFLGINQQWLLDACHDKKMELVDGQYIGVKTKEGKRILLEELAEEYYLNLNENAYGIYIPQEDILSRPKYQWIAALNGEDFLQSNMILSKYMAVSLVDSSQLPSVSNTGTIESSGSI